MAQMDSSPAYSERDLEICFSILKHLQSQLDSGAVPKEVRESLEVSIMCIQEVYGVQLENPALQAKYNSVPSLQQLFTHAHEEEKKKCEEAERLKNEGNVLLKQDEFQKAIDMYTRAIELNPYNAAYYANRAAAYIKTKDLSQALSNCQKAVELNPSYARAYGRMGIIYNSLGQLDQAREAFKKATELEPGNAEYKSSLDAIEQQLRQQPSASATTSDQTNPATASNGTAGGGGIPGLPNFSGKNLAGLFSNPAFMNLASSVMASPTFQNMALNMMARSSSEEAVPGGSAPGGLNLGEMMPQIQDVAKQMQENNPAMFEALRQQASQLQQDVGIAEQPQHQTKGAGDKSPDGDNPQE